jgi:hypothetical protein
MAFIIPEHATKAMPVQEWRNSSNQTSYRVMATNQTGDLQ